MKKLMIAAAIVCAAAVSQAAVANWTGTAGEILDGTATETTLASGTAYFFDAGQMSQAALFALISAGTEIGSGTTGYVGETAVNAGTVSLDFSHGEQGDGKTYNYYFTIVQADKTYFSNIVGAKPNASATAMSIGFGDQYDWSGEEVGFPANSNALPTEGYVGAGAWAAAVPEPTSGLLLLLGMAGLALRRRRA